jgi:hypothetical protein
MSRRRPHALVAQAIEEPVARVDRGIDGPPGPASVVCNSLGDAGAHGFLRRFEGAGL